VDVGQVPGIRESIGKAYDSVLDDPLGGPADEVLAVLRSPEFERIALERGPAFFDGQSGELIVRGRDIARMGYDASGVGLVKIIWRHGEKSKADPKLQVTREDIVSLPDMLVAYTPEPSGPRNRTMRWVVPDKSGISLVVVAGKRKGRSEPTTITLFKTDDSAKYPSSQKREAPASPNRRNPQRGQRTEGDTAEGTFGRDHQGQGLTARSLGPDEPEVNPYVEVPIGATLTREINGIATTAVKEVDGWAMYRDGKLRSRQKSKVQIVLFDDDWRRKNATSADSVSPRSPDFRVETPEEFTPAPPLSENARSALEDMGADEKTGTTLEEIQAVEQAELGLAPAEEAAALRVAQDAEVSRLRMEEEGYKLMGCIMEVSE
jgi:hypothetical protein